MRQKIVVGAIVVHDVMLKARDLETAAYRITRIRRDPKWAAGTCVELSRLAGHHKGSRARCTTMGFWDVYRKITAAELEQLQGKLPPALKKFRDALAKDYKDAKEYFVKLGFNSDKNELIRDVKVRTLGPLLKGLDKAIEAVWPSIKEKPSKPKRRR